MRRRTKAKSFYEVEEILDKRSEEDGSVSYFIKWKNYAVEESTWEPASNLKSIRSEIDLFEAKLRKESIEKQASSLKQTAKQLIKNQMKEIQLLIDGDGNEAGAEDEDEVQDADEVEVDGEDCDEAFEEFESKNVDDQLLRIIEETSEHDSLLDLKKGNELSGKQPISFNEHQENTFCSEAPQNEKSEQGQDLEDQKHSDKHAELEQEERFEPTNFSVQKNSEEEKCQKQEKKRKQLHKELENLKPRSKKHRLKKLSERKEIKDLPKKKMKHSSEEATKQSQSLKENKQEKEPLSKKEKKLKKKEIKTQQDQGQRCEPTDFNKITPQTQSHSKESADSQKISKIRLIANFDKRKSQTNEYVIEYVNKEIKILNTLEMMLECPIEFCKYLETALKRKYD